MTDRGWRRDALYLGVIGVIAVCFLWPAWLQPNSFWYPPHSEFCDITFTHWPKMTFVVESFRACGRIPLWIPSLLGGMPLVGNPLAAYFYPPNWLFLLLPVTLTFHVLFALDILIAGVTFYGLMRWSYGRSAFAAFVGALGFMLTPKFIAHIGAGHVGWCQAFGWLPLTLWLLRSAIHRRCAYRAAWCGAVLALTFFADPRVAFYHALLQGGYAFYRLLILGRRAGWPAAGGLALKLSLVPLTMFAVGAGQMLPTLELMSNTVRSAVTLQEAALDSLPWRYLLGYVLSDWGGYYEWMTYLGLAPLALAFWGMWARRRPDRLERWFWGALGVLCVLYSLGSNTPLYPLLFRLAPLMSWVRVPSRALLLVTLAANILASMGIDHLLEVEWTPQAGRWLSLAAFAGLLFCGILGVGLVLLMGADTAPAALLFSAVGAALMAWLFLFSKRLLRIFVLQAALVVIVFVDLYAVGHSQLIFRSGAEVLAENEAAALYLAEQPGRFRVYSPSYSVRQHVAARFGLEQLDGVDPSQLRWMVGLMALAGNYEVDGYPVTVPVFPAGDENWQMSMRGVAPNAALLGLLNAKFVVAEFPVDAPGLVLRKQTRNSYIYENERVMPRAFVVTSAEVVAGWPEALDRLAGGFDPAQGALVEAGTALAGPAGWQPAEVAFFSPNRIVVQADVTQQSLLVLSEVWYPGWAAEVDGIAQPIYRVDGAIRGVYLQPGAHVVVWRYRPAALRWGLIVTLAAAALLIAGGVWSRGRGRRDDGVF